GGSFAGGMQQAGACHPNRQPAAPMGGDAVALAKPGMLLGGQSGQRQLGVPLGGARGPIIGDRRPVPGQGNTLLGAAGKKNDMGVALKPVGGMVGSGKKPTEQQANKSPAVGGLTGGIKADARVGANAGAAASARKAPAVVAAKSNP